MTYIYLVRHCEAMGNHKRLFQGSTDCDISEIGAKQLQYLKERFHEKIYKKARGIRKRDRTEDLRRQGRDKLRI